MARSITRATASGPAANFPIGPSYASRTFAASAAGITVTSAKVAAGKLTVTGKTPSPNQQLKLDGAFTTTSNGSNIYTFTIATYLPADCIVDLTLVSGAATGTSIIAAPA